MSRRAIIDGHDNSPCAARYKLRGGAPNMCITTVKRSNFERPYLDDYWVTNEKLGRNSTDLSWGLGPARSQGTVPQLIAAEFFVCNPIVIEVWPLKV